MTSVLKWVVALAVIGGAGWWLWQAGYLKNMMPSTAATQQTGAVANALPATTTPPVPTNGMSAPTDASDTALAQDLLAIDAQFAGFATDTVAFEASLTDKPITQGY